MKKRVKMKRQKKIDSVLTLLVLLAIPTMVSSQVVEEKELESIAREIVEAAGNCALITLDEEGQPRARTMDPFAPENDFTIWFGTNTKSRKVRQINNDPRVTLYYFDKPSSSYVTLHGKAVIIQGAKEKKQYWKKEWAAFYPDYPNGYALIKVTPEWMEIISESKGISGDSISWQPPIVKF